uniref:Putative secreted protein n=1 Tax=Ixodes ricinus TaxID=34613 RepID=A0A6B0TZT0_IXORI
MCPLLCPLVRLLVCLLEWSSPAPCPAWRGTLHWRHATVGLDGNRWLTGQLVHQRRRTKQGQGCRHVGNGRHHHHLDDAVVDEQPAVP